MVLGSALAVYKTFPDVTTDEKVNALQAKVDELKKQNAEITEQIIFNNSVTKWRDIAKSKNFDFPKNIVYLKD